MTLAITPLYALPLAVLMVGLLLRVVALRWKFRVGIGDGGERTLAKAIRAHGNAAETIPLALVLMVVAELAGASSAVLHGSGIALIVGRVAHGYGLSMHSGTSPGRMVGVVLTLIAIITLAVAAVM